jgi:hypothetical protein
LFIILEDLFALTEHPDGSFVFTFGNASEIREKIAELNKQKLMPEGVVEEEGVGVLASDDGVEQLSNEDDSNLRGDIESSSTVVVGVADQNPPLLESENESSVVLDSEPESETPVINDLQVIDKHFKLDSVDDSDDQHGVCSEDVAAAAVEHNVVPSVSEEEDSQVGSHKEEVIVSTVSPAESDVFSDLSSVPSLETEEKEEGDILTYVVSP